MLTLEKLKAMRPQEIFATGITLNTKLHYDKVRWVAVRGEIPDWSIYYQLPTFTKSEVAYIGEKVTTKSVIEELVPCDSEAMEMYRY